jgi:sarcosine oxidase subunit gamma
VLPRVGVVSYLDDLHLLGLGPDEWLAVGPPGAVDRIIHRLGSLGSIVDVSAARTTVELSGPGARLLLAHGCALDLDRLAVGGCAQTMLAQAQVILWRTALAEFRILVRASFAGYLADWLLDASTELNHPSA